MKKLIALLLLLPALAFGQMYWQPPSGAAGGDLTGTYPNPAVNRIGGFGTDQVLAQSAVPASVTGTTTETVLATVAIPALSANSVVRVTAQYTYSGTAGNRNVNLRLNGVQVRQFLTASTVMSSETVTNIRNRGVNSQTVFGFGQAGSGTDVNAPISLTTNTAVPTTLTLLGSPVVSTDTVTLEGYTVELLNP